MNILKVIRIGEKVYKDDYCEMKYGFYVCSAHVEII